MKAVLFWLVILLLTFNACVKKETETFITGRFPDSRNSTLNLVSNDNYFPGLGTNNIIASIKTDSIGNFTFKIKQIQSGFFQILKNKYPAFRYDIFVEAGDSIYIEQSSWNEDPYLSISGKGSEKQFQNENIKPYKINFAPTYVLIDQDGNIVSARAERPNKVSEQIDKLLERLEK